MKRQWLLAQLKDESLESLTDLMSTVLPIWTTSGDPNHLEAAKFCRPKVGVDVRAPVYLRQLQGASSNSTTFRSRIEACVYHGFSRRRYSEYYLVGPDVTLYDSKSRDFAELGNKLINVDIAKAVRRAFKSPFQRLEYRNPRPWLGLEFATGVRVRES